MTVLGSRRAFHLQRRAAEVSIQLRQHLGQLLALLQRLAVPTLFVFENGNTLPLHRARDDHRGPVFDFTTLIQGIHNLPHIMPVDGHAVPAEIFKPPAEGLHVPLELRLLALAQAVYVDDADQVMELVVGGDMRRFPYAALGRLAVAHQDINPNVGFFKIESREGDPGAHGKSLA